MKILYAHDDTDFNELEVQVIQTRNFGTWDIEWRFAGKNDWNLEPHCQSLEHELAKELWRSGTLSVHIAIYFEEVTK